MTESALPIKGLPGWRRIALDEVGSTNAEALRMALQGDAGRLWITARRQIEGRARRGRTWISEAGNLYASLLLIDPAPAAALANLPLVAALAVYRALKPLFAKTPQALSIKWPNDILIDGAKVNGILLESTSLGDNGVAVVVGCGINCAHHPDNTLYPTTDLASCGINETPENVFGRLALSMAETMEIWNGGAGFGAIRDAWLMAARGIGEPVTVTFPDGSVSGIFERIDHEGFLCLLRDDGTRQRISAGDLFFS